MLDFDSYREHFFVRYHLLGLNPRATDGDVQQLGVDGFTRSVLHLNRNGEAAIVLNVVARGAIIESADYIDHAAFFVAKVLFAVCQSLRRGCG